MAHVLKSDPTPDTTPSAKSVSGLAGFNLSDLADEGRDRLEQCRQAIREMLADANAEADRLRAEAERQGYQAGLEKAAIDADEKLKREAEARAKDGLRTIRQATEQLHASHQAWMEQFSESLTAIALSATRKVLGRELQSDPQLLVRWAQEAVHSTRAAQSLSIAVHPETLAHLGQALDELLAAPGLPEQSHVVPDETVALGEVVIRQQGGEIHAGLQAQLRRLEEVLA